MRGCQGKFSFFRIKNRFCKREAPIRKYYVRRRRIIALWFGVQLRQLCSGTGAPTRNSVLKRLNLAGPPLCLALGNRLGNNEICANRLRERHTVSNCLGIANNNRGDSLCYRPQRLIPLERVKAVRELESVLRNAAASGRSKSLTRTPTVVTSQRPE